MPRGRAARNLAVTTYFGLDGASAAAQLLLHFPEAAVHFASQRSIARVLQGLAGGGFSELHICGVGLACPLEEALAALRRLRAARCRVFWHLCGNHLQSARAALSGVCSVQASPQAKNIAELMFADYGRSAPDAEQARLIRHIGTEFDKAGDIPALDRPTWPRIQDLKDLALGSIWRYFNYLDAESYPRAIRILAGLEAMNEEDERIIAVYRREGQRYLKGKSPALEAVKRLIRQYGPADRCVVIMGETGTGKEIVARLLHEASPRSGHPFHATNCATLRGELLQDTLFGHIKGAFTGAERDAAGVFELADGGTVFLDEISEMPMESQAMLLRLIQEGTYQRLGERRDRTSNVRVVAATQHDLLARAREGRFRSDLYYRLAVLTLTLPPLRERTEDIADLADHMLYCLARERGQKPIRLTPRQLAELRSHPWPGNVRELQNVMERFVVTGERDMRNLLDPVAPDNEAATEIVPLAEHEARYIRGVYERLDGNLTRAAEALGIARNTLKARLRESRA